MWILGHLTYSEANLVSSLIKGEQNPCADWKELFDAGTEPSADASLYPAMDELLAKFAEVRGQTLALLDTLTDADLDKPSHAPEEMQAFFGTVGSCLAAVIMHFTWHGGQAADARRALGRPPIMG